MRCEIVVPVYNGHDALGRCLAALERHTPRDCPIRLVDDASTDARVLPLLRAFAQRRANVQVVENESNAGFVGAVNRGLEGAPGDVVVLNADTEVTAGWVEGLERCRRSDPRIGIVCPLSNNATLLSLPPLGALFDGEGPDAIAACVRRAGTAAYPRIPTAVGFCMLLTRELLAGAGRLDAAFGRGYGEENDLAMRALDLGFEIACADDVYVHHHGEASFGEVGALDEAREQNRLRLERRWPAYRPGVSAWMRANPLRATLERINATCERERLPGRPRVLHVMHAFDSHGGVERHTRGIIEALRNDAAFNVLVPRGYHAGWADLLQERNAPHLRVSRVNRELFTAGVHVLEFRAGVRDLAVENAVAQFLAGGYDVVHFHSPVSWNTMALPRLAREAGARVVLSMHDMGWMCADYNMVGRDARPCGRAVARGGDAGCVECLRPKSFTVGNAPAGGIDEFIEERFAAAADAVAHADAIVCPSGFMARRLTAAFGDEVTGAIRVLAHGVLPLPPIHRPAERPVLAVAYVGRFSPQKGGHHFLEVARRLEGERIVFEVWGTIDERLRGAAQQAGVALRGEYAVADLAQHLRAVDLVVIPTPLEESFCLTLSEVHALGIPVAAARIGAIPERIRHGENGFLFEPGDIAGIAALLLGLRDDRARLARAAAAIASARPKTIAENAAEYLALYRELAANPAAPRHGQPPRPASVQRFMRMPRRRARTPLGTDEYDRWLASQGERPRAPGAAPASIVELPRGDAEALDLKSLNRAIASAAGEWVLLTQSGDRLDDDAAAAFAEAARANPRAVLLYADEDAMSERGERYDPCFKPDFSPELLRHRPYVAGICALRREAVLAMGGLRAPGWLGVVEVALRLAALQQPGLVARVDRILAHRLDANLAALERGEFRRRMNEIVSEAMRREGAQPVRLAAADGAPAMWSWRTPAEEPVTVFLRCDGVQAEAAGCLEALRGATHAWIAVIDARCRAFAARWIERLEQGIAHRYVAGIAPDVTGAAGERIAGAWVLGGGPWSVAGAAPAAPANDSLSILYTQPREVSCLAPWISLWRREAVNLPGVTHELGKAGCFGLAHLGLALRARGHDLLARPFAAAQCAAASALPARGPMSIPPLPPEAAWMRERWGASLDADPFFHPALSLSAPEVRVAPRFPPAKPGVVRLCAFPFDRWGSGELRVRQPCAALEAEGTADVVMMDTHDRPHAPNGREWRRLDAQAVLAHNFFHDYQLAALEEYARDGHALLVLGMDDLLTQLPPGNPYSQTIYPDIAQRIARARSLCDRLVVSTDELAQAYGDGIDVRVIPNALADEAWAGLANVPRVGARPRVGWAGARQHFDDLASIAALVQRTYREIDWVFFGMCPPALRRFAAEVHDMVPIGDYPATLASLGLDAAIAPLVDHPFNRAKSDLKVLEYGVLGIPVVASDVGPYRATPALRVDRIEGWIDAVRALAKDRDAAAARGRELREWVLTHRMLAQMLRHWRMALGNAR